VRLVRSFVGANVSQGMNYLDSMGMEYLAFAVALVIGFATAVLLLMICYCVASPAVRMDFRRQMQIQFPSWFNGVALYVMSYLAPLIAACIHSVCLFHRGVRFYQAELCEMDRMGVWIYLAALAIVPFMVLRFFGRRPLWRWTIWLCFVALWTFLCFKSETVSR